MSNTEDIVKELDTFKNSLRQYLGYDSQVGGLVSRLIKNLEEAQELLRETTSKNIQEAYVKVQTVRDALTPYMSYVPEMVRTINLLLEKVSKL